MDPFALIFQSLGILTNGLITDMSSAIVALIAIEFIILGVEHLKDLFEDRLAIRSRDRHYKEAEKFYRISQGADTEIEKSYFRRKYNQHLNKAVNTKTKLD